MKTIEQLTTEKTQLINSDLINNMPKIKEIEAQIKALKIQKALENVNRTCSDGSFHKTKIKKYPKLEALKHTRASKTKDNLILELSVNGEKFYMYRPDYKGRETQYIEFADFAEFLEYNGIEPKDLTLSEYLETLETLKAANEVLQTAIKAYKTTCDIPSNSKIVYKFIYLNIIMGRPKGQLTNMESWAILNCKEGHSFYSEKPDKQLTAIASVHGRCILGAKVTLK